jgi:kinetochore protein Nuf2
MLYPVLSSVTWIPELKLTFSQMAELKDNIENEVHMAHDEYLKMESHIKLYITEMEQSI